MNPQHAIVSGLNARPADSIGNPWQGNYIISSGNLLADFRANLNAESQGRVQAVRIYEMTDDPGLKDMLAVLIARDSYHQNLWMQAIKELEEKEGGKIVPTTFDRSQQREDIAFSLYNHSYNTEESKKGSWADGETPAGDGTFNYVEKPPFEGEIPSIQPSPKSVHNTLPEDKQMKYGDDYKALPVTSVRSGKGVEVLPDLYQYTVQIVNMFFYGKPDDSEYVIIDAGMPESADKIIEEAEKRFGVDKRPKAIILTHGHFDHVGSIIELIRYWDIPVYAHLEELPYLTGKEDYPKPDASVDGGMISKMSPAFPHRAIDLGGNVHALPEDGSVPHMPGFDWIHTPGHSPGQVSLFREEDRALITGDAFVTVDQDSLYNVLSQKEGIYGPPRYLTTDWDLAYQSVKKLYDLTPQYALTGHGPTLSGKDLGDQLAELVQNFDEIAKPDKGKYVDDE